MKRPALLPLVLLGGLVLSVLAYAANAAAPLLGPDLLPRWAKGGLYVGGSGANVTATNKVTSMLATQCDYDFPSIAPGYSIHQTDKTCALTGVKVGDPCGVAIAETTANGDDGGSPWSFGMAFFAVARASGVVEVSASNVAGDGGSFNMPDAGYIVRCISNQ